MKRSIAFAYEVAASGIRSIRNDGFVNEEIPKRDRLRKPTQQEADEAPLEVSRVQLAIREVHRTPAWKEQHR